MNREGVVYEIAPVQSARDERKKTGKESNVGNEFQGHEDVMSASRPKDMGGGGGAHWLLIKADSCAQANSH